MTERVAAAPGAEWEPSILNARNSFLALNSFQVIEPSKLKFNT
jgi:hypothetical protein